MPDTTAMRASMGALLASPRALHLANPLLTGPDVEELQQLLASYHPGAADGVFGPVTAAAVKRAKWALGYPEPDCDGSADPKLMAYLEGLPLPLDYEARRRVRLHDAARAETVRAQIVANAIWGVAHAADIHYQQVRPIDGLRRARQLPLHTDCSGFVTLCYAWAGAPDPNGLDYSGQGYTGTLLRHMTPVPPAAVRPGDLVVWGPPPGHHVAVVLKGGSDPVVCSHGEEKGPREGRFSVESETQPAPATWLSCLP